jgi:hypothetical protein
VSHIGWCHADDLSLHKFDLARPVNDRGMLGELDELGRGEAGRHLVAAIEIWPVV